VLWGATSPKHSGQDEEWAMTGGTAAQTSGDGDAALRWRGDLSVGWQVEIAEAASATA